MVIASPPTHQDSFVSNQHQMHTFGLCVLHELGTIRRWRRLDQPRTLRLHSILFLGIWRGCPGSIAVRWNHLNRSLFKTDATLLLLNLFRFQFHFFCEPSWPRLVRAKPALSHVVEQLFQRPKTASQTVAAVCEYWLEVWGMPAQQFTVGYRCTVLCQVWSHCDLERMRCPSSIRFVQACSV